MPCLSPYALKLDVSPYTVDATHYTLIAKEEKMGISFLAGNWNSKWGCASRSVDLNYVFLPQGSIRQQK
jgi:hypothetical protein